LFAAARISTQRFPWNTSTYEALTSSPLTHCGQSATGQHSCLQINISHRENEQDNGTFTKRKSFVNNPQEHPQSQSVTNEGEHDKADENRRGTETETTRRAESDVEPWPYWVEPEA
jgi:hypothetical protein